jgi:ATP-dependent DNA helicase RecG
MLPLIEAGHQAALMVPTELLGKQHTIAISKLVEPLGLRVGMLSGKLSAKERNTLLADLASGALHIVIGTHALFQQSVTFARLGMVVIDEQHRFGVEQRLALSAKGQAPHVLLMTATPIPRSLTMTAYGDMDSSTLREKPAGRPRIDTRAVTLSRIDEVIDGLKRSIAIGSKVYWICPLVEEPDPETENAFEGDLAAAEERHRVFQQLFGSRVALAHGKMKPAEREAAMQAFAGDGADILVATTVVEVGVDVPDATIIVIEHAERFGLAQLHQLRGRVGRSDKPSSCILLYQPKCSEMARQRLKIIRESDDGFRIAEEDLMLRGAGDVLGTRQSGLPDYRFADLAVHRELVYTARDDVKLILHRDASLQTPRGQALRSLLYLFEYDSSLHYVQAG